MLDFFFVQSIYGKRVKVNYMNVIKGAKNRSYEFVAEKSRMVLYDFLILTFIGVFWWAF